jgi:hypothetical protein
MRALGELWVFQLQIRPEHRCVRERAQHTCVFHLRTPYVHHGGLTPPLLVARRSFAVKSDIRGAKTHVHKSGGRQPAVVRRIASASAVRRISAFGARVRNASHGGLTPPALVADTTSVRRKNDDFCDEQTHVYKSGGRQPAVASETRLRWSCESYPETKAVEHGEREHAVAFRTASASAVR